MVQQCMRCIFQYPLAGAVLNTINTRLVAKNIAYILKHSEAKVLCVDYSTCGCLASDS